MFNGCPWRLLKVATSFGCAPYLVGASPRWAPEISRRRIPGKPEIPPLQCSPSWGWHRRSGAACSTWFVFLDVDQAEQAAPLRPLVEPHRSVASFDDSD